MKVLLTTLNSKYIHTNLAVKYIEKSMKAKLGNLENLDICKAEFTINNSDDYLYNEIIAGEYDIVCFSCYIWNIQKTLHLCSKLKKANSKTVILLGGPEVSFDSQSILEKYDFVDIVVSGEGEEIIPLTVSQIYENGFEKRKVCRGELLSAEQIPFPYEGEDIEPNKIIYYESTRGCPYNCSYCMSSIDKKVRALPMERVKRELKYFLSQNIKQLKFIDRTFNWNKERSYEIFKYLIDNDNGITNFHFEICAENMSEEAIKLISSARKGLFQFEIGIQSTCEKTLKAVDRLSDVELLLAKTKSLIGMGNSHIHVDLIAGLPYETYDMFKKSFNDVYALKADALQLGFLKLLKGTKIRGEEAKHEFRYDDKAPYQIITNKYISPMEIVKLKRIEHVLDDYYNKGGFNRSLEYLEECVGDAFEFYDKFAEFYFEKGYQHASHKKEDNYRILNKFAEEKLHKSSVKDIIYEDMKNRLNFDAIKKFDKKGWDI